MIRLTANLSKKVPIAGMEYSSQSFMAGIEVELSDVAGMDDIHRRIGQLYSMLEQSIDEQIGNHQTVRQVSAGNAPASNNRARYRDNNRGDSAHNAGVSHPASQAQLKAIGAISREHGLSDADLNGMLQQNFRKSCPQELTLREASRLISLLKDTRQAG